MRDAQATLGVTTERWNELKAEPEGANSPEWPIEQTRANEAAARAFWPLGNTRLEKRLPLIEAPTLLVWGEEDRIVPRSYADRFAGQIEEAEDRAGDGDDKRQIDPASPRVMMPAQAALGYRGRFRHETLN